MRETFPGRCVYGYFRISREPGGDRVALFWNLFKEEWSIFRARKLVLQTVGRVRRGVVLVSSDGRSGAWFRALLAAGMVSLGIVLGASDGRSGAPFGALLAAGMIFHGVVFPLISDVRHRPGPSFWEPKYRPFLEPLQRRVLDFGGGGIGAGLGWGLGWLGAFPRFASTTQCPIFLLKL